MLLAIDTGRNLLLTSLVFREGSGSLMFGQNVSSLR